MKVSILFLTIIFVSGLLFVNIYTSIVDARSWGANIPSSIKVAREYYKTVNPGNFFRIFSPMAQVLALLTLIVFWKASTQIRLLLGGAFLIVIAADLFTFAYFYPRNHIMFNDDLATNIKEITAAWKQWSVMNWVRSVIILPALIFLFRAAHLIYQLKP